MAAAWVSSLSLAQIVVEIMQNIDFLSTSMANVPPRLRSIRAVFDATWLRLTDEERHVFARLSVFHGGCTHEAGQIIAGANPGILAALVSKALLRYSFEEARYEIHELMNTEGVSEVLVIPIPLHKSRASERGYNQAELIAKVLIQKTGNSVLQQKEVGLHTLRHSIATHLLVHGMSLEKIKDFLGHSSMDSTQIYTHLINNEDGKI